MSAEERGQLSSGPAERPEHHHRDGGARLLRVLVCFKAVPELEALTGSDWQPDDRFQVDVRFAKTVINPLDESALEMSLKLRDQAEKSGLIAHLTALTIGDGKADSILKTLYALKFNRVVRIENDVDLRFNPEQVAAYIHAFVSGPDHFDLVVMGGRSADGDNGRVPLLLAEALDWPCLTQVTDFKLKGDCLEVANLIDDGELVQIVRPPVILAVGNAPATYLRVPTLKDKMSHGKREIERPTPSENAVSPAYELRLLRYEQHERDAVIIEGSTPAEKAERLYYDYLKDRL